MRARRRGALAALILGVLAIAGCGASAHDTAVENFPNLGEDGYRPVNCETGDTLSTVPEPADTVPALQCWTGTPDVAFYTAADQIVAQLVIATEGRDFTATACPEDYLNDAGGVACRAVVVGDGDDQVVVQVVVALTDVLGVLDQLPEDPSQTDIGAALIDAPVEVLIGTSELETTS